MFNIQSLSFSICLYVSYTFFALDSAVIDSKYTTLLKSIRLMSFFRKRSIVCGTTIKSNTQQALADTAYCNRVNKFTLKIKEIRVSKALTKIRLFHRKHRLKLK